VFLGLGISIAVIILDQLSKYFVLYHFLGLNSYIPFGEYFNIVRAWNTGVSFSMFNSYGNLGAWLLSFLAIAIVLALFYWLRKEQNKIIQLALGMIMGGAIGNVIDRIRFGAVFDFLDVHIGEAHWPAFNIADSFICIGAAIVIAHAIFSKIKDKRS